ncbi:MAG TPA: hypothetical protein VK698_39395 [Kofleriaceae bacterium]|nr:hypothetical protein [Kofleriaceae bacterium]
MDTVYRYAAVLAAICTLLVADAALGAHTWWCRLRGAHDETPMFLRLNRAVGWADRDPNLPDRWRDPRDVAAARQGSDAYNALEG